MTQGPRLALTLGDPGGIGPEITVRALAVLAGEPFVPVVYGQRTVWQRACAVAGLPDPLDGEGLVECDDATLEELPFGGPHPRHGLASLRYLARATDDLVAGRVDGLCTAPLAKAAVQRHDPDFIGHTEYLQQRFGVPRVVMLMAGERLRVALATTHVALAEVSGRLSVDELVEMLTLTARGLEQRFGLVSPRLAVLGLNPHAGEHGRFGDEELRIIGPAIERARAAGLRVEGPFAADGLFPRVLDSGFDAVVAMYHDQGLIPFKMLEFHTGVNVTLGLPRPRTSPDHGTAYDIAGQGVADPRSMISALRLCLKLARAG